MCSPPQFALDLVRNVCGSFQSLYSECVVFLPPFPLQSPIFVKSQVSFTLQSCRFWFTPKRPVKVSVFLVFGKRERTNTHQDAAFWVVFFPQRQPNPTTNHFAVHKENQATMPVVVQAISVRWVTVHLLAYSMQRHCLFTPASS